MNIRDLLFHPNGKPKPYIIYNAMQAWEYKDLLPDDTFDINPFDIEIENIADKRFLCYNHFDLPFNLLFLYPFFQGQLFF